MKESNVQPPVAKKWYDAGCRSLDERCKTMQVYEYLMNNRYPRMYQSCMFSHVRATKYRLIEHTVDFELSRRCKCLLDIHTKLT
jgi:hypothetical protein